MTTRSKVLLQIFKIAVALPFIPALSGCGAIEVRLGTRVDLAKTPVTSMQVSLPKGPGIAPGEKSPLVVTATGPDDEVLVTEGQGGGKIEWRDLKIAATVVSANDKGIVSLPQDPRVSDGKTGHVTITAPSHPDLSAQLDIPVRYDYKFNSSFSGSSGFSGIDGTSGMDGTSGSMGSIDPNSPSPGGDGTSGTNGSNGTDGGAGGDGPPVQVRVALRAGSHPLLQVGVSAQNHESFFLVDPDGGSLTVASLGGSGGSGGKGGRGGRGGSGGIGSPNGNSGSDGVDGTSGSSGRDGSGGRITVTYDPQAKPYLGTFHLSDPGGPAPVFTQQPVAALW
jgi:hypothetical protein